ncbi:hypothetical protein J6590_084746 [Homalodisca vitripennis]|nr:hypothetical protein J6590_084746 [Homalodisca vitripennis]
MCLKRCLGAGDHTNTVERSATTPEIVWKMESLSECHLPKCKPTLLLRTIVHPFSCVTRTITELGDSHIEMKRHAQFEVYRSLRFRDIANTDRQKLHFPASRVMGYRVQGQEIRERQSSNLEPFLRLDRLYISSGRFALAYCFRFHRNIFVADIFWTYSDEHDSRFHESSLRQRQIPDSTLSGGRTGAELDIHSECLSLN